MILYYHFSFIWEKVAPSSFCAWWRRGFAAGPAANRAFLNLVWLDSVIVAHGRLLILGSGEGRRLHEEILYAGGQLRQGRFSRLPASRLRDLLAGATCDPVPPPLQRRLLEQLPVHRDALLQALTARMRERAAAQEKALADRAAAEERDIAALLTELRRTILAELDADQAPQLELFTPTEKEQLTRDRDNLRARAERIPAEIEAERAAVRARYADPAPRLFPLSITCLCPARLCQAGDLGDR